MKSESAGIPVAPGKLPWLGHSFPLGRDACRFFKEQYLDLGSVYRFSIPGRNYIALAGIEANQFLMKHEDVYLSSKETYPLITKELDTPNHLNAMDGEAHHAYRRVVSPLLRDSLLTGEALEQIESHVAKTAERWSNAGEISVLTEMQRLFLDVFGILVSRSPAGHLDHVFRSFTNTFITTGAGIKPKWFLKLPGYVRAKQTMNRYLGSLIEKINTSDDSEVDTLLDRLRHIKMPNGQPPGEQEQLALVLLPYLNSTLYVGRAATTMIYHLLDRPDIIEAIQHESNGAYLTGALYESLRLVPMAVAHPRVVKKSFEFDGKRIAEGNHVMFTVSVTHFLEEFFPNPDSFQPERYVKEGGFAYRPPAYSAFGLGSHACLGARLVESLMGVVFPILLEHVEFTRSPKHPDMVWTADPIPGPSEKWVVRTKQRMGKTKGHTLAF